MGAIISFIKTILLSNIPLQLQNTGPVFENAENDREENSKEMSPYDINIKLKPTPYLITYMRSKSWDHIIMRMISHPNDIRYVEKTNGSTPLHIAAQHRDMPIEILKAIVLRRPESLLQQDVNGFTPLHFGLLYGLEDDALLFMIQTGGKPTVEICNERGWSALHLACRVGIGIKVFSKLIELSPKMIFKPNEGYIYPSQMMWMLFTQKSQHYESLVAFNNNPSRKRKAQEEVELIWNNMVLLIQRAACIMTLECEEERQLWEQRESLPHAFTLIRKKLGLPSVCLDLILNIHSDSISIPNSKGRLLFHTLCAIETDPIALLAILNKYPHAAKRIDPITLNYPLISIIQNPSSFMNWSVISPVWKVCPDANMHRDPNTGLFPFMIAATSCQCHGRLCCCLDTIYGLLVRAPHLVLVGQSSE